MKALALLFAFLAQPTPPGGGYGIHTPAVPSAVNAHWNDDIKASFGGTSAAPDCSFEWDTAATPDAMQLVCSDIDGAGTDGVVCYVDAGTRVWHCLGGLTIAGELAGATSVDATTEATIEAAIDSLGAILYSGNQDLAGYDIENPDSVLFDAKGTDAAVTNYSTTSQGPFEGVNAAQTAGADICNIPATGAINVTGVTRAGTALDTITIAGVLETCAAYSVTLTEGTDYVCAAAASDAACVCNLKAAIDAHATLGPLTTTYATDGTCSDEKLAIFRAGQALTVIMTPSDTTNTVRVAGTGGSVVVSAGTAAAPGLKVGSNATGLYAFTADIVGVTGGGAHKGYLGTYLVWGGEVQTGSNFQLGEGGHISWGASRGKFTSPINGYVRLSTHEATGGGAWQSYGQTITCADSGDGNPSTCGGAQTINSSVVAVNCADANGCTLTLAETNWGATAVGIVAMVAGTTQTGQLTLADSAGVVELAGGVSWTPAAGDTLNLMYNPSALTWAELGARGDNTP